MPEQFEANLLEPWVTPHSRLATGTPAPVHSPTPAAEPSRCPRRTTGSDRSLKSTRDGQPIAVLIHDPAVLGDPDLLQAVASAAQLAASNAQLQLAVQARLSELKASRRRILEAHDEERRLLDRRLHNGAEQRLERIGSQLSRAQSVSVSQSTVERIDRAETQLKLTVQELRELARGLHPRVLSEDGLHAALVSLTKNFTIPVEISVTRTSIPPDVEAACYFLCSEALANVVKHASASTVRIAVGSIGQKIMVTVEDDGVGGADPSLGSGLRGLSDRLESLGGGLQVVSVAGHGTRLAAEISLDGEIQFSESATSDVS